MRFIGLLLILAGLLVGYELAYRGKTIQQMGGDLKAFFGAQQAGGASALGWSGSALSSSMTLTPNGSTPRPVSPGGGGYFQP